MAIDVETPYSDGWWLERLARQLHDRRTGRGWSRTAKHNEGRPGLDLLDDYRRGEPPLPEFAAGWPVEMRAFLRMSRRNYAPMVITSATDRMLPLGFRTAVEDDRDGDSVAAEVYARNGLGTKLSDVFGGMLTLGDAYMIISEPDGDSGIPIVTAEDAREVITAHDPRTGRVMAALKMFRDEWDSTDFAYLYVPGRISVASHRGRPVLGGKHLRLAAKSWDWDEVRSGDLPAGLAGRVPVIRFRNRDGVGDFEPHLDVLDYIADTSFALKVLEKHQAHRQRAVIGLPDKDPATGLEIDYSDAFLASPGGMWQMPPDTKVWESGTTDFNGPITMLDKAVIALATVTGTPLHYVRPDAANTAAEGVVAMREQNVFRVEDRRRRAEDPLAEGMSLVFAAMGDVARAEAYRIKTIWQPAERYSQNERMNAATMAKAAGLPQSSIYTDVLHYPPGEVPRLERERTRDLLFAPAFQAPVVERPARRELAA